MLTVFAADDAKIGIGTATGKCGVGETVTATVDIASNPGFCVLECVISYDADKLHFDTYKKGTAIAVGMMFACSGGNGEVKIAATGMVPSTVNGTVVELSFSAVEAGECNLNIESLKLYDFDEKELPIAIGDKCAIKINEVEETTTVAPVIPNPSKPTVSTTAKEEKEEPLVTTVELVDDSKEEPELQEPFFSDVMEEHWAFDAIQKMTELGYISGIGDGLFGESHTMTRGAMVTLLYRIADKPSFNNSEKFLDVSEDSWYYDSVMWAKETGIVSGIGDNLFAPEANITREQLVVILWNIAGKPESMHLIAGFVDADDVSDWAMTAVQWAVEVGLLNGKPGGLIDPQGITTRAEATVVLYRSL